jgi:membrane-bound lytic murein transglycosylase D
MRVSRDFWPKSRINIAYPFVKIEARSTRKRCARRYHAQVLCCPNRAGGTLMPLSILRGHLRTFCSVLFIAAVLQSTSAAAGELYPEELPPGRPAATPAPLPSAAPPPALEPPAASKAVPNANAGSAPAPQAAPSAPAAAMPSPAAVLQTTPAAPVLSEPVLTAPPAAPDGQLVTVTVGRVDVWARIRAGFRMADLSGSLVDDKVKYYASRPDYMQRMTERGSRYLFYIVEEIERRNMPMELALLPFIESAFNPVALSTAQAAGMWQFIPSTGKHYNLKQNMWKDERRDVRESTRAALDYFQKLYNQFGDWHLALASYNWGEGSVGRAIAKNQRAGLAADYQSLDMPNETRHYIPKLQAIKNLVSTPESYGISLPEVPNQPYFVSVSKARDIDVSTAAKLAEMPLEDFRALNPSFNRPVILGATKPEILLPADKVDVFLGNLESYDKPLSTWMAYTVGKTERPAAIAARFGISEVALRDANRIPPKMRIRPGSTLLVPRPRHIMQDISAALASSASLSIEPDLPAFIRVTHTVRKGESLGSIARRYRVTETQIRGWNKLGASVSVGQRLSLQVKPSKRAYVKSKARPMAKGKITAKKKVAAPKRK